MRLSIYSLVFLYQKGELYKKCHLIYGAMYTPKSSMSSKIPSEKKFRSHMIFFYNGADEIRKKRLLIYQDVFEKDMKIIIRWVS